MRLITLFLIILFITSCQKSNYIEIKIDNEASANIKLNYLSVKGLDTILVAGDYLSDLDATANRFDLSIPIVYVHLNKSKDFVKCKFANGSVKAIQIVDNTFFVLVNKSFPNSISINDNLSILYSSNDGGKTWDKMSELNTYGYVMHFIDNNMGYLVTRRLNSNEPDIIKYTNNGGRTWLNALNISSLNTDIFYDNESLFCFDIFDKSLLYSIKKDSSRNNYFKIEGEDVLVKKGCFTQNKIYFLGQNFLGNKIYVHEFINNNAVLRSEFDCDPSVIKFCNYYDNKIYILLSSKSRNLILEYNITTNKWQQTIVPYLLVGSETFFHENRLYSLVSGSSSIYYMDL